MDRAVEHLGPVRAGRYLRKFYPWYVERLGGGKALQAALQATATVDEARAVLAGSAARPPSPLDAVSNGCLGSGAILPGLSTRPMTASPPAGGVFRTRTAPESAMPKDVILTPEGLEKLTTQLEELQTDERRKVAERIKEAREFGDISENSEYDDAKNEQAMLEAKIAQIEERLRSAQVIDAKDLSTDVVQVGSVVHVKDEKTGKSQKFTIVGSAEAKPAELKLSNESPVGRALIGKKRNETVSVPVPRGPARKLKITKIDVGL